MKTKTKSREYWQNYTVLTNGNVAVGNTYDVGHSMKCKWTLTVNEHHNHGKAGQWWVAEDTEKRKVIAYKDKIVKMLVFQLTAIDTLVEVPKSKELI